MADCLPVSLINICSRTFLSLANCRVCLPGLDAGVLISYVLIMIGGDAGGTVTITVSFWLPATSPGCFGQTS